MQSDIKFRIQKMRESRRWSSSFYKVEVAELLELLSILEAMADAQDHIAELKKTREVDQSELHKPMTI